MTDVADQAIAAPKAVYRLVNTAKNAGKRSVLMRIKPGDIAKYIAFPPGLFYAFSWKRIHLCVVVYEKHPPDLRIWSLPISFALPKSSTLSLLR
jgi:hypothetical protein